LKELEAHHLERALPKPPPVRKRRRDRSEQQPSLFAEADK
jgi:hypothetical protein